MNNLKPVSIVVIAIMILSGCAEKEEQIQYPHFESACDYVDAEEVILEEMITKVRGQSWHQWSDEEKIDYLDDTFRHQMEGLYNEKTSRFSFAEIAECPNIESIVTMIDEIIAEMDILGESLGYQ
ncbi:hypothetical protein QLX67_09140 [Balneolaceae bacterium ANBcel3]|nr:hypothetical protein [Balneolaceae bacterium ANBcel3]